MAKMRAPIDFGGTSLPYQVTPGGTVEVHSDHVEALTSHGFVAVSDEIQDIPIEKMTHAQMISYVLGETKKSLDSMSEAQLRAHLLARDPVQVENLPDEREAAGVVIPEAVTSEDLENFNRPQLFGYLKSRGVVVGPGEGVTTAHLRALCKDHLASVEAAKAAA